MSAAPSLSRGNLVDEIVAQLADHPQSLGELAGRLGEGVREVVLAMESFGGLAVTHTQDGTKIYGLSDSG